MCAAGRVLWHGVQWHANVCEAAKPEQELSHSFGFRQPNVRTIEGVLFSAMVKAGAVSQDNADDPVKVTLPSLPDVIERKSPFFVAGWSCACCSH
jgi:hypothetical protein